MCFVMASACNCTDAQRLVQGESMWVDKYTPRSFLELLGDEEINREVVRWLKCWDRCVFGDRAGAAPSGVAKGRPGHDSRPEEKILLICGAPGEQLSTMQDAKHLLYRRMLPQISASIHNMAGSRPEMSANPITGLCDATSNAAHIVALEMPCVLLSIKARDVGVQHLSNRLAMLSPGSEVFGSPCRAGEDHAGACGGAALRLSGSGDQRQR